MINAILNSKSIQITLGKKAIPGCRYMPRKQLQVLFSDKESPETVYLDCLLKNCKTKKRVSTIFDLKKRF